MATKSSRSLGIAVRARHPGRAHVRRLRAEDIVTQLNGSDAGRSFMSNLSKYLDEFGWRADSVYELTHPSWREDPSIAINAIQGYLAIPDDRSPDSQLASAIKRREELLAQARNKIGNDAATLKKFNDVYEATSSFTPIVEDHNHWIDQMGDITMRYPALELGKRCVAKGTLASAEDVSHLERTDIREALSGIDKKALAAGRKTELERFARVVPPPFIGPPPPPSDDPVVDVIVRFFGLPVEPSADPSIINGVAASPGTVTATAKVVRSLERPRAAGGDVLMRDDAAAVDAAVQRASAVVADRGIFALRHRRVSTAPMRGRHDDGHAVIKTAATQSTQGRGGSS